MNTVRNILNEIENKFQKSQDENYSEGYRKQLFKNAMNDISHYNLFTEFEEIKHDRIPCRLFNKSMRMATVENKSGVYLVGCQILLGENIVHCLKIGMSSKLHQRVKSYQSYNPGIKLIDIYYTNEPMEWEKHLQEDLKRVAKPWGFEGSQEWFPVTEEIYNLALENGFNFLNIYC